MNRVDSVVWKWVDLYLFHSSCDFFDWVEQSVESDVGNDSSISSLVDSIFKKLKKESKNAELKKENPVSKWFKDRMEDFNAKPEKGEEAPVGALSPQDLFKQGQMLMKRERENKKEEQPV